jgi:cobalt-zinc-cadmium efflux system protein
MKGTKVIWIIIFNVFIILSEIFFGVISNSYALVADALHNTGDVMALVITFIAIKLGQKQATFNYTFGFLKAEMMAAFVNSLFLSLTMLYMIYQAIYRVFYPEPIESVYMIVMGTIAIIANGLSAYFLNKMNIGHSHHHHSHSHSHEKHHHEGEHHHSHEDANIKSAYLHMLSDTLISVGVVVAGIFIFYFKIYYIDSILTMIFSIFILKHSYPLLKESFLSLLDANITDISIETLDEIIKFDKNILEYHDLHISKPSSKYNFISFHIVLENSNLNLDEVEELTTTIKEKLKEHNFNHILIQVDTKSHIRNTINCQLGNE